MEGGEVAEDHSKNVFIRIYSWIESIIIKIFFVKLLFIKIVYSYELFMFKNICKMTLFIKNIFRIIFSLNVFIKRYIHKENIFIRGIYSIFFAQLPAVAAGDWGTELEA